MPNLKEIAEASANPQLLSVLGVAVKRAAYSILIDTNSNTSLVDWAKRAHFGVTPRAEWYASRILEGAIAENQFVRDAIDASIAAGGGEIEISDAQLIAIVQTWVARFAASGI